MFKRRLVSVAVVSCLFPFVFARGIDAIQHRGELTGKQYKNPALGMRITLPEGSWNFQPNPPERTEPNPNCKGPLCSAPEVNISLESKRDGSLAHAIFIAGYKLEKQYLDRSRYPLKLFAASMITGSLNGTGWTSIDELTSIHLDGRPAFRQRVRKSNGQLGYGYVSESNGYVFLLVGIGLSNPEQIQTAIENMRLGE